MQRCWIEQHGPDLLRRALHGGLPRTAKPPVSFPGRRGDRAARWRRWFGAAHEVREPCRDQRQRDIGEPKRIRHRIGNADRRRHAIADALRPERCEGRRRLHVDYLRLRHLGSGRQQIVGQRSRQEASIIAVGIFLVERSAQGLREAAVDLPVHHAGMQDRAAIMHGHVAVDACFKGGAIDLHAAEIEDEAVAERGVDAILIVRRRQFRWRPEHGLANGLTGVVRKGARRPMAERGHA